MSKAAILALADRVQALTGPCRETDAQVRVSIERDKTAEYFANDDGSVSAYANGRKVDRLISRSYTASLDAAISLYPELPDTVPSCPRKATSAALRAIAAQMPDEGDPQ
jgi:hypothetical protein